VRQVFALLHQTGAQYSAVEWSGTMVLFAALFPNTSAKGVNILISFHSSSKRQLAKILLIAKNKYDFAENLMSNVKQSCHDVTA